MIPHGRRDGWLTAAIIAVLVCRAIRGRWRCVVAVVRRLGRCAHPRRQGHDVLTADDKERLTAWAARARRGERHGDDRHFPP
jgi:hypothetical protein